MLIALSVLAVMDLIVGVSNDAVNFLNSAIGSKALSFRNILIIASLGVFLGAATSSGMMEVARKGIFVPGEFYFNEVMYIFMAVMITDILLLDVFNTLGLPTSTTVSIVFELLGAAVIMALIKVSVSDAETISDIGKYINSAKALEIIIGIFVSVIIAFTVGAIVMFVSRSIYSFNFDAKHKIYNAVFAGIAVTAITYFIIIKGIKGSGFYSSVKEILDFNPILVLIISFVFWTLVAYILTTFTKLNILKFIIGIGTFSLALAFAGNDLVNFIGVPMAALASYELWSVQEVAAESFLMHGLAKGAQTNSLLLLLAGAIMVVTLWLSKKARNVTETEINLARQNEGAEKFRPNDLSRVVVRGASFANDIFVKLVPDSWSTYINKQFSKPVVELPLHKKHELPAFDMIRASVNLVMSAILISWATSLKLPLSTTYVTFMVAMGTSLADRAWGLESAVYRVAGVFSVIGGWFITAITAFIVSGVFVYFIYLGKITAVAVLLILVFGLIFKNFMSFQKNQQEKKEQELKQIVTNRNISQVVEESSDNIAEIVRRVNKLYTNVYQDLSNHDLNKLKKNKKHVDKLDDEVKRLKDEVFYYIKTLDDQSLEASKFYILILRYIQDISQSIHYISTSSFEHVNNNHRRLKKSQLEDLKNIESELTGMFSKVEEIFNTKTLEHLQPLIEVKSKLFSYIEDLVNKQVNRIRQEETSAKNVTLYFGILLETRDLLEATIKMLELYEKFYFETSETK
jgi:phosphate/sulfate permease